MNTIKKIYKQFGENPFINRISELHNGVQSNAEITAKFDKEDFTIGHRGNTLDVAILSVYALCFALRELLKLNKDSTIRIIITAALLEIICDNICYELEPYLGDNKTREAVGAILTSYGKAAQAEPKQESHELS